MANSPDIRTLSFLGRRVERLIFGGILLVVICCMEAYLTTANKQIAEDRSVNTIERLLNQLTADEPRLSTLFEVKPDKTSNKFLASDEDAVNETRKLLGLPPPHSKHAERQRQPRTYQDALDNVISEIEKDPYMQRDEIMKYVDPTKPPKQLIQTLRNQLEEKEGAPTTVWGIQTPRLLKLQYAGLDYKFPFGFVSSILAIALAPLIIGWLGAFYATRQRELMLIAAADDYKVAFPYILNFFPVNFQSLNRQFNTRSTIRSQNSATHSNNPFSV